MTSGYQILRAYGSTGALRMTGGYGPKGTLRMTPSESWTVNE